MALFIRILTAFAFVMAQIFASVSPSMAQNLRAQSGIVAATSGPVRVVSENIGKIATTGQKIYLNDIIETGTGGKLQLLLMDRTTMTIGPKTSIIIDEFVYDPGVERSLTATVLKGTFKLASPSLNTKNKQSRKLNLPNATVSIRGTELIGSVGAELQNVVLLNGAISVANGGISQDIDRPNFGVNISNTGDISAPEFFSTEDIGSLLNQLEGTAAQDNNEAAAEDGQEDGQEDETAEEGATEEAATEEGGETAETGEVQSAEAGTTETTQETQETTFTARTFGEAEGEPPTEAEVVAAAEAIKDGSADAGDLQVLARSGPESIARVASILGVEVDEETGEITGSPETILAPTIANIVEREGGDFEGGELAIPGLDVSVSETGEVVINSFSPEGFEGGEISPEDFALALGGNFGGGNFEGGTFEGGTFEGGTFESGGFVGGNFESEGFEQEGFQGSSFDTAAFERSFEASFESSFETSFEGGFEMNFETDFVPSFAPIEIDPAAFQILSDFTSFEQTESFSFFNFDGFEGEEVDYGFSFINNFDEPTADELDEQVTEALEVVVEEFANDVDSFIPDHTFIPDYDRYRSWNGSEWAAIAQNFDSGTVSFVHNNVEANFVSGNVCQDCTAIVSSTVRIDFSEMNYQFTGEGTFYKPGYNPVSFAETTPDIDLNYWELSTGTQLRLPNERELESTFDDDTDYTLTLTADPSTTITANIDLDFLYDSQLEDNNNPSSDLGVHGYMEVEFTDAGGDEGTLRTADEAMIPQE